MMQRRKFLGNAVAAAAVTAPPAIIQVRFFMLKAQARAAPPAVTACERSDRGFYALNDI